MSSKENPWERGPKGDSGHAGETGHAGQPGHVGPTGPSGERGPTGDHGQTGLTGQTGAIGERGPTGGERGPTGDHGQDGQDGLPGKTGRGVSRAQIVTGFLLIMFCFGLLAYRSEINARHIRQNIHKQELSRYQDCLRSLEIYKKLDLRMPVCAVPNS